MSDKSLNPAQSKDVFRLRKEKQLAEATALGAALYAAYPNDGWVTRAYAWCLYDGAKSCMATNAAPALEAIVEKLSHLKIPAEDEILNGQVAYLLKAADPDNRLVTEATRLSKAGQHGEAVRAIRALVIQGDATQGVVMAYGWILYRKLKQTDLDSKRPQRVWCLEEFLRCWRDEWPPDPMLTKCLLLEAIKHADNWEGFSAFVGKMGLARLKPTDWVDERPDVDFGPFQHQVLKAIYQNLKHYPRLRVHNEDLQAWFNAWGDQLCGAEWPEYHLGRILAWTGGDLEKARSLLIKTVQRNPSDFWRWSALADAVEAEKKIAVLAKAVSCPSPDETFKIGLYQEFAELLAQSALIDEARASYDEFLRLLRLSGKEFNGTKPTWYADSTPPGALAKLVQARIGEAEEILWQTLPGCLCSVLARLPPKEGKKGDLYLAYFDSIGVRRVKFKCTPPKLGAEVILATASCQDAGISIVYKWEMAKMPESWGYTATGVVRGVNLEKRLVAITTQSIPFMPIGLDRWPSAQSLHIGDCVELRLIENEDNRPPFILNWEKLPRSIQIPGVTLAVGGVYRAVHGKEFGFINYQDIRVFVSPEHARKLTNQSDVSCMAIVSVDKNGKMGWAYLHSL